MKLQTRFGIFLTLIAVLGITAFAVFMYRNTTNRALRHADEKARIVLGEIEAVQAYFREVVRPHMYELLPPDDFTVELMSTSYVAREVAKRFGDISPDYYFKQASINPRNPLNQADQLEMEIIEQFRANPDMQEWQGTATKDGRRYQYLMRPYVMLELCLKCHSTPEQAPQQIVDRYGTTGGFGRHVGDIPGVKAIGVPVEAAFAQARHDFLSIMVFGLLSIVILSGLVFLLFRRTVIMPLREITDTFTEIAHDSNQIGRQLEVGSGDEIGTLTGAFNGMSAELWQRTQELKEARDHLEEEVRQRTTELRQANRELEKADCLKSEFLANMSHELRTPLNSILGFAEILHDGICGNLTSEQKEYILDIHSSGKHLLQMINDILDLSKIEAGKMELHCDWLSLGGVLSAAESIVRDLAHRKQLTLSLHVPECLPAVYADETKVKQVMYNLLSNAIKFTPEGGDITVSASLEGTQFQISVRDTGMGISKEDQSSLFDEFVLGPPYEL